MQNLEENLKDMSNKNEQLKEENQKLKERILVLETEVIIKAIISFFL
jgi:cell shape-determining protein MreC